MKMTESQLLEYNLDNDAEFHESLSTVSDPSTLNFGVAFDTDKACCTVNLSSKGIQDFLNTDSTSGRPICRWLNVWTSSEDEHAAIKQVASRYGVSPRLTHLLCPRAPSPTPMPGIRQATSNNKVDTFSEVNSLEKASSRSTPSHPIPLQYYNEEASKIRMAGIIDITKDLWHFCSIDWGHHFVCIGFNSLFTSSSSSHSPGSSSRKPDAIRIWTALLLCDDGTVISVFETPPDATPQVLKTIRKNQINVFKNLSARCTPEQTQNPLFQVDIRTSNHDSEDNFAMASRLFYYLFDDWRTTFELVSGRQHPYRSRLDALRAKMSRSAEVEDVEALHKIGQQLLVLQRVYQSYEKIVDRLLQRQRHLSSIPGSLVRHLSEESVRNLDASEMQHKTIRLPLSTIARFERLLDRIRLYALTEITECLVEKESLVLMNFNLVNLKNAAAIEKLTRTTVLLAKATILFLPVSLVTGYFSLQMDQINELYSLKTYWLSFLVVALLTVALLITFSVAGERVEGKIMYQSLTRTLLNSVRIRHQR